MLFAQSPYPGCHIFVTLLDSSVQTVLRFCAVYLLAPLEDVLHKAQSPSESGPGSLLKAFVAARGPTHGISILQ